FIGQNYSENVDAFTEGRVDLAQFGGVTYLTAKSRSPDSIPIVQRAADRHFHALFLTQTGSGIETLADLKGKRFAFVDRLSTSGYLIPSLELFEAGVDPRTLVPVFTHAHDASLEALVHGEVD